MIPEFKFEKYWSLNFFSILNYETLLNYVHDEDSMKVFTNKHGFRHDENNDLLLIPENDDSRPGIHLSIKQDVVSATEVMNNQLIVYMATIIESAINDYLYCLFTIDPHRLKIVKNEDRFGFSYDDFIKYDSKDEYISILATRAAGIYSTGKIDIVLRRMIDISGVSFEASIHRIITEITMFRNEIVHENKHHDFKIDQLKIFSEAIDQFLKQLARKLIELKVIVNDPGNLIQ